MSPAESKDALRRDIWTRRQGLTEQQWSRADAARTELLLAALGETSATVALYASRAHEPGTHEAISRLHASGWHILLPVLSRAPQWALFTGWEHMHRGWADIPEPSGSQEAVGLDHADVVVVACLAVARNGTRLGTGGGWYDRALPLRRSGASVWALANHDEVLDSLPAEPHDVPVDEVITDRGRHACDDSAVTGISATWQGELS